LNTFLAIRGRGGILKFQGTKRLFIILGGIIIIVAGFCPLAMAQGQNVKKEEQKKQAKIDAEGQADATRALAQGQADANNLLTKSLTPELIQYTLIQKLSPTIKTMILPSGQNFILDPNQLLGQ